MSEHQEQCAVFDWANYRTGAMPELMLMFAIPNGGHRHKATAAKLKNEGVKAGVPDICLPVARRGYHSLWIEMKTKKGRVRPSQEKWLEDLEAQGHRVEVCRGASAAIDVLEWYLSDE